MRKKVALLIKICHSTIRLPFIKLGNFGGIKCGFPVALSINSVIQSNKKAKIILGSRCDIEENTKISARSGKIEIGERVYINRNGTIVCHEAITIGEGTTFGPNIVIYDHDHDFRNAKKGRFKSAPITIGKNVWVGASTIILKGVTIGDNAVIGAGCVITKDVPDNVVVINDTQQKIMELKKK
ncbi:acyltransferase [Priestia megaterium]|uniref:acyltransferase n=1 Tax=Priestia megaterium TaxID=1404 RepID=UPI0039A2148A